MGSDVNSDNDLQFGQLNDMANVGLAVIKAAGENARKLKISKLVDAVILYRRPDWRGKLESLERKLRCPRCPKLQSFIESKEEKTVTCLSCGMTLPTESVRFKISVHKIDLEYVDLVHSVVTSKWPTFPN